MPLDCGSRTSELNIERPQLGTKSKSQYGDTVNWADEPSSSNWRNQQTLNISIEEFYGSKQARVTEQETLRNFCPHAAWNLNCLGTKWWRFPVILKSCIHVMQRASVKENLSSALWQKQRLYFQDSSIICSWMKLVFLQTHADVFLSNMEVE